MMVSIIVPVYNTGKYLRQCVESVLIQSFKDWELLLLNDGSTDDSGVVCDEYSQLDSRIRTIHKRNSGVSDTRNHGIDVAEGEYIIFLDSDDYWLDESFLEEFVLFSNEHKLDVLRGEYIEVDSLGTPMSGSQFVLDRQFYEKRRVDNMTFIKNIVRGEYFSVMCLFRKSYITNLRFNINRVFLEDAEFYLSLLCNKGAFSYLSKCFYAYRKHPDAVSVKYVPQKLKDAFDFSRFCFMQTDNGGGQYKYRKFCAEEGVKNYLFDISVISDKVCDNKSLLEYNRLYDLTNLRREVVFKVREYKLYRCLLAWLPLPLLVRYYNCKHKLRLLIKGV